LQIDSPAQPLPVPADPATDRADLDALRRGDDIALNRIISRWERPLIGFAFRYLGNSADACDQVAETFVRLYRNRERLHPESNLPAWLFTALANLCRNRSRWNRRHPTVALDSIEDGASAVSARLCSDEPDPRVKLQRAEMIEALEKAVAALPHELKATLLLCHYERLSHREIGVVLGCSERGIETRLRRARRQLRADLGLNWAT
jgi:RNA polymerase sigma-70 factor (ECF subfamily)